MNDVFKNLEKYSSYIKPVSLDMIDKACIILEFNKLLNRPNILKKMLPKNKHALTHLT